MEMYKPEASWASPCAPISQSVPSAVKTRLLLLLLCACLLCLPVSMVYTLLSRSTCTLDVRYIHVRRLVSCRTLTVLATIHMISYVLLQTQLMCDHMTAHTDVSAFLRVIACAAMTMRAG